MYTRSTFAHFTILDGRFEVEFFRGIMRQAVQGHCLRFSNFFGSFLDEIPLPTKNAQGSYLSFDLSSKAIKLGVGSNPPFPHLRECTFKPGLFDLQIIRPSFAF